MKTKYIIPFLLIIGMACNKNDSAGGSIGGPIHVGLGLAREEIFLSGFYRYNPSTSTWTRVEGAELPGEGRAGAVASVVNGQVYVGLGGREEKEGEDIFFNDFYSYNPSTGTWTKKAVFPGGGKVFAVAFAVNGQVYVGLGGREEKEGENIFFDDFYSYNPSTDTWTKKAAFPGGGRTGAVAFAVGGQGYVGLGWDSSGYKNDFYSYDPLTDTWTKKAAFPGGGRTGAVAFAVGGQGYVGLGKDGSVYKNDFYSYDPLSGWKKLSDFLGEGRASAVAFAVGGQGYVGLGGKQVEEDVSFEDDFYSYNPSTGTWTKKAVFPGGGRVFAVAFSLPIE